MRDRTERRRVSARRRVTEHKTGGGSNYINRPDGWDFLSIDEKNSPYRFDFMPYRVGKGNPYADKGDLHYERTFFIHRGIGPNNEWHLCAAKTLKRPCPICEFRGQLAKDPDADEKLIKSLAPSERQLWLPVWLEEPEVQYLWEFSYHNFGKSLDAKIKNSDEEDEYEFFADTETGLTVRVSFEQSDAGKWLECTDIEFKPRKKQYDADIVDSMPCLDDLLIETPYDKLKAIFLQTGETDGEDEEEKPRRDRSSRRKSDDVKPDRQEEDEPKKPKTPTADEFGLEEGMMVKHPKFGKCEIRRISGDGTSLTLLDSDDDVYKGIGCDEVKVAGKGKSKAADFLKDDGEEENPKKSSNPKKESVKASKEGADDDWDDWD